MRKQTVFLAMALFLGFVHPAMANWQFTRWGMTPDQVIAASDGKASAMSAEDSRARSAGKLTAKAEMPYITGDYAFRADFSFDPNDKLAEVKLDLKQGSISTLRVALEQKYGTPFKRDVWHSSSDEIILFGIGETSGFIVYRPLANSDNSGL